MLEDNMRYVLLAACRDNELALEIDVAGGKRGVFSYALCEVLRSIMGTSNNDTVDILNEFNWLEIFPDVVKRVKELVCGKVSESGNKCEQNPQLLGLRSWRIFGTNFKPVPRYFPAELETVTELEDGTVFLTVKMEAGYLHGVGQDNKWELEVVQPTQVAQQKGNIIFNIIDQQITQVNPATSSLEFSIESPSKETFPIGTGTKLKALQFFNWYKTGSTQLRMYYNLQGTKMNSNTSINKSSESDQSCSKFTSSTKFAQRILECAQMTNKYSIEVSPEELALKSITSNKIVFASKPNGHLQFLKNVDCFIRCTYLLEWPLLYGPQKDPMWSASAKSVLDDVKIGLFLKYQPTQKPLVQPLTNRAHGRIESLL